MSLVDEFPPIQGCLPLHEVKRQYINSISNKIEKFPKIRLTIKGSLKKCSRLVLLYSGATSSLIDYSTFLGLGYNKKHLNVENKPLLMDVSKNYLSVLGTVNLVVRYPCKNHSNNKTKRVRFIVVR